MAETLYDPLFEQLEAEVTAVLVDRRTLLRVAAFGAVLGGTGLLVEGCSSDTTPAAVDGTSAAASPNTTATSEVMTDDEFLVQAGESLIALHEESHGGWRFKSEIQAPHY